MRTNYFNGDEITLTATGCDGCSPSMINGIMCHEGGCPESWRDRENECRQCGFGFYPEFFGETYCPDCVRGE